MTQDLPGPEQIADLRDDATRAWQECFGDLDGTWALVPLDLGPVLAPFGVKVDPAWELLVVAVRFGRDGEGMTVAVPAARAGAVRQGLESVLPSWEEDEPPPVPDAAADVGVALLGERSPRGLLLASLAVRELAEVGASGHGRSWLDEQVVGGAGSLPHLAADWGEPKDHMEWSWTAGPVYDWNPAVTVEDGGAEVVFYTYDPVGSHQLIRHRDRYGPTGLTAARSRTLVAEALGGIIP